MKHKSASQKLVKECIFTALLLLMEQKNYQDITITDITKKAGVSRMAYYRNYASKEDILREQAKETFTTLASYSDNQARPDASSFYKHFFMEVRNNQGVISNLQRAGLLETFWDEFMDYLARIYSTYFQWQIADNGASDIFYFFSGGLLNLIKKWVDKDKTADYDYMISFAAELHGYFDDRLT